eukprot:scpid113480/ scgid13517/ 
MARVTGPGVTTLSMIPALYAVQCCEYIPTQYYSLGSRESAGAFYHDSLVPSSFVPSLHGDSLFTQSTIAQYHTRGVTHGRTGSTTFLPGQQESAPNSDI